jgi:hypothetical protein
MRGTNVGNWEFVRIASGGGSTSLTFTKNLVNTYTDSGASQAQLIKFPRYKNVIATSSTNPADWDSNVGGVLAFAAKQLAGSATFNGVGYGYNQTGDGNDNFGKGDSGEGNIGDGLDGNNAANGTGGGGGGGGSRETPGGGAGGGHATAGANGTGSGPGIGGGTVGQNEPTTIFMGGAGGSGGGGYNASGLGGPGGAIAILFIKRIIAPTLIDFGGSNGGNGTSGTYNSGDGGGGAGGSVLICTEIADIGTDAIRVAGGVSGTGPGQDGGSGGKGRIAIYYGVSLAGSINSTYYGSYYTEKDVSLIDASGGAFLLFV